MIYTWRSRHSRLRVLGFGLEASLLCFALLVSFSGATNERVVFHNIHRVTRAKEESKRQRPQGRLSTERPKSQEHTQDEKGTYRDLVMKECRGRVAKKGHKGR